MFSLWMKRCIATSNDHERGSCAGINTSRLFSTLCKVYLAAKHSHTQKPPRFSLDGFCRCVAFAWSFLRRAISNAAAPASPLGRTARYASLSALPVCRGQRSPMVGMLSPVLMLIKQRCCPNGFTRILAR